MDHLNSPSSFPPTSQVQGDDQLEQKNAPQQAPPQLLNPLTQPQQTVHTPISTDSEAGQINESGNSSIYSQQSINPIPGMVAAQKPMAQPIQPLLDSTTDSANSMVAPHTNETQNLQQTQEAPTQQISPQRTIVTKVKLTDELNIFDWFRTTDIINQIAEKARSSVDSVITTLDPGMKEYIYSGGNINIIVISHLECLISPIRDAFQSVFGRATVVAARYNPPEAADEFPIKLACGFDEAITVALEKIKKLRLDASTVPQNQVVVAVQPTLVMVGHGEESTTTAPNLKENLLPKWFLTYCMLIEDPVLGITIHSYSQFIPIDSDIVEAARRIPYPQDFTQKNLGFAISIPELIGNKLNLTPIDSDDSGWLKIWSGLDEPDVIHNLSISLAHLYRRKWNDCVSSPAT